MSQYTAADWQIQDAGGGGITAYNGTTKERFSGSIAAFNAKVKLVPPGGSQLVKAVVNPAGVTEFLGEDGQVLSSGGGGIKPDATGTLAARSTYNAFAVGFVYLATDRNPAEYFFREGAAGNWSAAVTVQGPVGTQGPQGIQGLQGPQGIQGLQGLQGIPGSTGATGAQGPAGTDGVTFVSGAVNPSDADGRVNGTVYVKY